MLMRRGQVRPLALIKSSDASAATLGASCIQTATLTAL